MSDERRSTSRLDRRGFVRSASLALAPFLAVAAPREGTARTRRQRAERLVAADDPATIPAPPRPPAARETMVEVADGSLRCLDTGGDGAAVVLLHATTGSASAWDYQAGALVDAGYRVVTYARRGARGSPTRVPPAIALEVEDLRRVLDALRLERCHLVGTASGAFIAVRFALAEPHRIRSLTVTCSLVGLDEPDYVAKLDALLPRAFNAMPSEFKELSPSYRAANPQGVQRWLAVEAESWNATMKSDPGLTQSMATGVRASGGPRFEDLRRLDLPVLLLYGDADLYAPPALARILAANLPRARLVVVAETGHSAHWEQPRVFNRELLAFIGEDRR